MKKIRKFRCGFRKDFMLSWNELYYDGPFLNVNLGWFWFAYNKDGLPYLFQDDEEEE